jgi:type II secretory pathway component PulF
MIPDLYVSQMKMAERSGSYGAAFDYLEGVVEKMTSDRQERFLKFLGPCSMLAVGGCMVLMVLRCLGPLYEMIQGVS